ncbi:MAG: nuclear transport factor 2 family protein [Pseudomonadota bacterium]
MTNFQDAKSVVRHHYADLAKATPQTVEAILAKRMPQNGLWRGVHPFNAQSGPEGAAAVFWRPFLSAFGAVQRREDIFFAGQSVTGDTSAIWVMSMGHLMGLFDADFLNIPATRKIAMLRYAEFHRIEDGQIVETAFFCDILHLMSQAGIKRFPNQTAVHLVQPGPQTHDGILLDPHAPAEGQKTIHVIERMAQAINDANRQLDTWDPHVELAANWTEDMLWWGPEGIGSTYTIDRYIEQHQGPFRRLLTDRVFNGHLCRIGEGNYGAFFGWPNLSLTNTNGYMEVPPSETRADMRVVDVYRRSGDKLAENWVFIDMLHFLNMQGIDVLAELAFGAAPQINQRPPHPLHAQRERPI